MPDYVPPLPDADLAPPGMVPFATGSTAGARLSGYGPRGPVMPPSSVSGANGGVPMPDVGNIYQQAFSHLPVDEAGKAVEAALKYQGMRGYQQDLAGGVPAQQALAKWAPLLLGSSAAAVARAVTPPRPPQMTPYQLAEIDLRRNPPVKPPAQMTPYESAEIDLRRTAADKEKKATISIPIDPADTTGPKITGPADDPDVMRYQKAYDEFYAEKAKPKPPPVPGPVSKAGSWIADKVKDYFDGGTNPAQAQVQVQAPIAAKTPEEKAATAKTLHAQHPEWTRQQIIEAVNK